MDTLFSVQYLFQDFITQYKILLPKGLISSREDIEEFLQGLDLNNENYQIGKTKVCSLI